MRDSEEHVIVGVITRRRGNYIAGDTDVVTFREVTLNHSERVKISVTTPNYALYK